MSKTIEPKLKKIGEYLKLEDEVKFIIPEYQRAYSWGITQCDKLWQDIIDFTENKGKDNYFFGTIIVNCQNNDEELALIDGQQRTTTFLLLLKALLVAIEEKIIHVSQDAESERLSNALKDRRKTIINILYKVSTDDIPMSNKNVDKSFYQRVSILENKSINEQYKEELVTILQSANFEQAQNNVVKIKFKRQDNRYTNFFRNFKFFYEKANDLPESRLNTITRMILEYCEVIEIKSWQVEQAIKMFNSLNSDGLPLSDSDVISAHLFAIAKGQAKEKEFSEQWKELKSQLDNWGEGKIFDLDSLLMQYMYLIRTVNGETVSDKGAVNVTVPGLRRYFTEINKKVTQNPLQMCKAMSNLVTVWQAVTAYPLMKVLLKFNDNSKLFVASYLSRYSGKELCKEQIDIILECMLRLFVILELSDYGYSSRYFKTFLFGVAVKLADASVSEGIIKSDFDSWIENNWDRETIKSTIEAYDGNMLVYLNEFLFAKEHNDKSFDILSKCDIEHIMPASGKNIQLVRQDAGINSKEEFNGFVDKLGNKILLEAKINRSIGREWFSTKVSSKLEDKIGYVDSRYPIAQKLVEQYKNVQKSYWTKDDIVKATKIASERIVKFIFDL